MSVVTLGGSKTRPETSKTKKSTGDVGKAVERALRFGDGNVEVSNGGESRGVVNLSGGGNRSGGRQHTATTSGRHGDNVTPTNTTSKPSVTPRNAWPEGKFTIIYPKGFDPGKGKFLAKGEGDVNKRVTVEKKPLSERLKMEEQRVLQEQASAEAAKALNLDQEYLEKVTAQQQEAAARKRKRKSNAFLETTETSRMDGSVKKPEVTPLVERPKPQRVTPHTDPALLQAVGVDEQYLKRMAEQSEERRKILDARAKKTKTVSNKISPNDPTVDREYNERYKKISLERESIKSRVAEGRAEAAREELKKSAAKEKGKGMGKRQKR